MSTEQPMSIEDRVRTATRAGATLVRDIGPFTEPDQAPARRAPAPGPRRWRSWGIPLAAAAAVVLVALSLVAVRHFSAPAPAPTGPAALPTSVPRYYVALDQGETFASGTAGSSGSAGHAVLIVGDDLTGQAIATVNPPRGMLFYSVQGGSDDRTFVVLAGRGGDGPPDTWYLIRLEPGTAHPYRLVKLPIRLPSRSPEGYAYALSPDDRELAIESLDTPTRSRPLGTTLTVYSVSSGAELRAWTVGEDIAQGMAQDTLSWLADGRQLVFSDIPPDAVRGGYLQNQLRTIDLAGSGTALLADSRALLTVKSPASNPASCLTMHATPDGGTVICGTQYRVLSGAGTKADCTDGGLEFTAYAVRTGKPVRVLYRYQGACSLGYTSVLWTDASARHVIGALEFEEVSQEGKQAGLLGVISDGRLRLLRMAKALPAWAYGTVAF